MSDRQRVENVIQGLRALQSPKLNIIRFGENISSEPSSKRASDASNDASDYPSPASYEADLSHYKELFSKLRFSYIEQTTKEKFLRAITNEPPHVVEPSENTELESQLVSVKSSLKAQKEQVAEMVNELDARGRDLSRRYETISLQTTLLSTLPAQIDQLSQTIENLATRNQLNNTEEGRPELLMPLPKTLEMLADRQGALEEANKQLKTLQQALPRQTRAVENEERELSVLEGEKNRAVMAAREAVERKRQGGDADDLEMRGRWLRSVEGGLKGMLGVEAQG